MSFDKLKIYGERNTGTNYLEKIARTNLSTKVLSGVAPWYIQWLEVITPGKENLRTWYFDKTYHKNLGWKHQRVDINELQDQNILTENVAFVCLVKNPYSWLLSFYKRAHHYEKMHFRSFDHFLNSKLELLPRDKMTFTVLNPIELWNHKNMSYWSLSSSKQSFIVKYEALLENPEKTIDEIATRFDFHKKGKFINEVKSTKSKSGKTFYDYQEYYIQEMWKQKLSSENISLINNQLDPDLMKKLGYEFL